MIKYERTFDIRYIRDCLTDNDVWRVSTDDATKRSVDKHFIYVPIKRDTFIWLKAGGYGVFLGVKEEDSSYELHTVLKPNARGLAIDLARGALKWLFTNTRCQRATTTVPEFNKLAARLASRSGMKLVGQKDKPFIRDGVEHIQFIYEIHKEDVCPLS